LGSLASPAWVRRRGSRRFKRLRRGCHAGVRALRPGRMQALDENPMMHGASFSSRRGGRAGENLATGGCGAHRGWPGECSERVGGGRRTSTTQQRLLSPRRWPPATVRPCSPATATDGRRCLHGTKRATNGVSDRALRHDQNGTEREGRGVEARQRQQPPPVATAARWCARQGKAELLSAQEGGWSDGRGFWWRSGWTGGALGRFIPCRAVHGTPSPASAKQGGGSGGLAEKGGGLRVGATVSPFGRERASAAT
jgi:hypothetical protein